MGVDASKIHVIPMGINLAEWKSPDGERFRRRHHLEGKTLVLFAGTKDYNKGAVHVLRAVDQLAQKLNDLTLVSMGLATPEWREALRRLPQIPLLDLGYAPEDEKQDAFDACDLFVMPSRYDSFGIVYLEAWRCGKPVIGARVGAVAEVIEDGKNGLLVEFGDEEQLASAILSLVQNPELRVSLGESGKKRVIERFNWQENIGKVEEVFRGARG
jgi:glycosyltransferase involved in cell wall biosynthesis